MVRLDALIPEPNYGSVYGSSVLKGLQNMDIPRLDLLVREAVQNSLDAAQGEPDPSCRVKFNVSSFSPRDLHGLFDKVDDVLASSYGGETTDFLEIRDVKTSGLNGSIHKRDLAKEDHGNFLKLIFDSGKKQTNSQSGTAGGSWGYGKSVYYRLGIGLVIFYTRIRVGEAYESRLIAALIEDEDRKDSLLRMMEEQAGKGPNSVGRAWWGVLEKEGQEILPLRDEAKIEEILGIFSLTPFKRKETGTAVIIPFIDKKQLLEEVSLSDLDLGAEELARCTWKDTLEGYLKFSLEKWYAPKIENKTLESYGDMIPDRKVKWLDARVNGAAISKVAMYKPFLLAQELYNAALAQCIGETYQSDFFKDICYEEIKIKNTLEDTKAGVSAYIRISKSALFSDRSMIPLAAYLGKMPSDVDGSAVCMFARLPGMILDYKVMDKWTAKLPVPGKDEYLFAFFVPNSSNPLKKDKKNGEYGGETVGEYLRQCERSDHQDWMDRPSMTIVGRIQDQIGRKISERFKKENQAPTDSAYSGLSKKVGAVLLPLPGKRKSSSPGGGGSSPGGGDTTSVRFTTGAPHFLKDEIKIPFCCAFKALRQTATFEIYVETEAGEWNRKKWSDNLKAPYPFAICRIEDCVVKGKDKEEEPLAGVASLTKREIVGERESKVELLGDGVLTGFTIRVADRKSEMHGVLAISTRDRRYSCAIKESKVK